MTAPCIRTTRTGTAYPPVYGVPKMAEWAERPRPSLLERLFSKETTR